MRVWVAALWLGCSAKSPLALSDLSVGVHSDLSSLPDLSSRPDLSSLSDLGSLPDLIPVMAGGPNGVCSPGSMSTGVYDPDCVYLLGSLRPGLAGWQALVYPGLPDDYAVGFYDPTAGVIRPSDGRLLFMDNGGPQIFVPSSIPSSGNFPLAKNQALATPPCPGAYPLVFPDDSAVGYACGSDDSFHVQGQSAALYTLLYTTIYAAGPGRVLLTNKVGVPTLLTPGGDIVVQNPWSDQPITARYSGDGFLVVVVAAAAPIMNLWKVRLDGTTINLGTYQGGNQVDFFQCKLELSGALQCPATKLTQQDSAYGVVVRFTLTDPPQIVYDDTAQPVKLDISYLFTGP
jgi:hypothetical protein